MRVRRKVKRTSTADRSSPTSERSKTTSSNVPVHVGHWLKKALAGPARGRKERFENLAHELSDLIIEKAERGSIKWVELLLKKAEDKKVTHTQLAEIIDYVFLVMSKHVTDPAIRAAIFEDLSARIPHMYPKLDEE